MNPLDIKKRLYREMGQAADEMSRDDLRKRYGPKPAAAAAAPEAPAELTEDELEPLLSLTISTAAQPEAVEEPLEEELPPEVA